MKNKILLTLLLALTFGLCQAQQHLKKLMIRTIPGFAIQGVNHVIKDHEQIVTTANNSLFSVGIVNIVLSHPEFISMDPEYFRDFYTVYFDSTQHKTDSVIKRLQAMPGILYAEELSKVFLHQVNTLQPAAELSNLWYLDKIHANDAWAHIGSTPGMTKIKVAVIDDAVNTLHPDLAGNIWTNPGEIPGDNIDNDGNGFIDDIHGWNFVDGNGVVDPPISTLSFFHGTHVAGLVAAVTSNGIGIPSLTNNYAEIIAIRVGEGGGFVMDEWYAGIYYAVKTGCKIINLSLGGDGHNLSMRQAISYAQSRGILVVASSGNDSRDNSIDPMYPADLNGVIGVGATDMFDHIASFSNYGGGIDVMAPGHQIYSTFYNTPAYPYDYFLLDGTSMSAPIVSSLLALMQSYKPGLQTSAYRQCLTSTADNINAMNPSYTGKMGSGRINALNAIKCIELFKSIEFSSNFQTVCAGEPVKFATLVLPIPGSVQYQWTFPGGIPSSSTAANPAVSYYNTGTYDVKLVITIDGTPYTLEKKQYIQVNVAGNYKFTNKVDNNWNFYTSSGLDFNTDPPAASHVNALEYNSTDCEGGASISNGDGNLLFYTTGAKIYNRHHEIMSNGDLYSPVLLSNTQNAIIVPSFLACDNQYYVFYLDESRVLRYCIVDMDLDNGLGEVIPQNRGTAMGPEPLAEKLTAIFKCDKTGAWVIVHEDNSDIFWSYLVDAGGVHYNNRVQSIAGHIYNTSVDASVISGFLKGSPAGNLLAAAVRSPGMSQLFDFNRATGSVSNARTMGDPLDRYYGCEFSSDGSRIYLTNGYCNYVLTSAPATTLSISLPPPPFITMELGPDGVIYANTQNGDAIHTILKNNTLPEVELSKIDMGTYEIKAQLNNGFISKSLNYVSNSNPLLPKTFYLCGISAGVTIDAGAGWGCYRWKHGPTTQLVTINAPGTYEVEVCDEEGCLHSISFEVVPMQNAVPQTIEKCAPSFPYVLDASGGFASYSWNDGSTGQRKTIALPGMYTVTLVTHQGCIYTRNYVVKQGVDGPFTIYDDVCEGQMDYVLKPGGCFPQLTSNGSSVNFMIGNTSAPYNYDLYAPFPYSFPVPADKLNEKISMEVTLANGCICRTDYILNVKKEEHVFDKTVCDKGYFKLAPACNNAPWIKHEWYGGANDFVVLDPVTNLPSADGTIDMDLRGNYQIVFPRSLTVVSSQANGCKCSTVYNIETKPTVGPPTAVTAQYPLNICGNNPYTATIDPDPLCAGITYAWREVTGNRNLGLGLTIQPDNLYPPGMKLYALTAYDADGCIMCVRHYYLNWRDENEIDWNNDNIQERIVYKCGTSGFSFNSFCDLSEGTSIKWFSYEENFSYQVISSGFSPPNTPLSNSHFTYGKNRYLRVLYDQYGCVICIDKFVIYQGATLAEYGSVTELKSFSVCKSQVTGGCITFPADLEFGPEMCALSSNNPGGIIVSRSGGVLTACFPGAIPSVFQIFDICSIGPCSYKRLIYTINMMECKKTPSGPLAITDENTLTQVKVYPNPNKGSFNIDPGSGNTIRDPEIFDITGKKIEVICQVLAGDIIEVKVAASVAPGYYTLSVFINNERRYFKIAIL